MDLYNSGMVILMVVAVLLCIFLVWALWPTGPQRDVLADINMGDTNHPDIYDNGQSTVIIRVNKKLDLGVDSALVAVIALKEAWIVGNPNKKFVSWTSITGDLGGHGHPGLMGVMIHYEVIMPEVPRT